MYDMTIKHILNEHQNQISKNHLKALKDCLEVVHNDDTCIIYKVKKGKGFDLVKLGCFDGDETMFRLTKTKNCGTHTCTKWNAEGKAFSWQFGSSTSCVGDNLTRVREMLVWLTKDEFNTELEL